MSRARPFLHVALCAVAVTAMGCRNDGDAQSKQDATASPPPTATATASDMPATATPSVTPTATRRPGVPDPVNTVINLVLAGDLAAVERSVSLVSLPCGPQQGPGSPPACPPGQPNGTPVQVFPVATCEGELRPASAVRPTLEQVVLARPVLTGVYRAPRPYLPPVQADYVVVFSRTPTGAGTGPLGAGIVMAGDKIAGVWFGCGASPAEIVRPGTEALYLPGG